MHEKQITMIRKLSRGAKPISGKQLASALGVSTRTVINYMNELNSLYEEPVILSTPGGYVIDRERAAALVEKVNTIPDGYHERAFYICKRLLLEGAKQLDAFELSDDMCISYSLLKNDLQKMNQSFAYLNVKFNIRNNSVVISGAEKDKRKLMNHILTQAQEANLLDLATLKQYFPEQAVDDILVILEEIHQENGYYLNDFSKINILLHVLTMVIRILNGNSMAFETERELDFADGKDADYKLSAMLCGKLEHRFPIEIGAADRIQLYFLIKSNSSLLEAKTEGSLAAYVGKALVEQMKAIIGETENKFCIRLNSNEFFMRFALHISSMHARNANDMQIINPLKASLRSSSPFLFDIAIYIAGQLQKAGIIQEALSEDEISFLVLHIGAEIERQNVTDNKISCALMIPEYLDIGTTIAHKLLNRFGEQILIKKIVTLKDSRFPEDCDLAVSVVDKNVPAKGQQVSISPFLTAADYNAVSNAIDRVQMKRSLEYLRKNFDFYFSPDNFLIDPCEKLERDGAVNRLCDVLIQNGYVTGDYRENVFKRENASPTAFFDFAIPHSVCMEAKINAIGVLIAPNGIRWNEHLVYVVFLMAIAPDSLTDFQTLYSILAQILTDTNVMKILRNSGSFGEFKKQILNPWIY